MVTDSGIASTTRRRVLRHLSPKAFNEGLATCNRTGMQFVGVAPGGRFLDVGCGDGELTLTFQSVVKAAEVHGVEFVDELRDKATAGGIVCTKADLNEALPYESDFFDLVLSSQSIEHLHNTRLFLEECCRCLKPGGQLIVLTENLASWINIGALVLGWQPFSLTNVNGWTVGNPLTWHLDLEKEVESSSLGDLAGHVRVLSYAALRDLMVAAGFSSTSIRSAGYLPLWGRPSDELCRLDPRHGHFLIATGFKSTGAS